MKTLPMVTITQITARQILDSRGRPTVEASVQLSDGTLATSSVPSGAINNEKYEAVELRDNKPNEFFGYGVTQAVSNVNTTIAQALMGKDPLYQTQIDQALVDLDGTKNKSKLGANAILAVSQANMKAAAASLRLPLFVYIKEKYKLIDAYRIPTPIFNLINGGKHGSGTLDFQEFQLVPASHLPYPQALRIGVEFFLGIEKALEQKGAITTVGLEGGFSPNLATNADALEIFNEAAKSTSYTLSQDAFLGIDLGPSTFYRNSKYSIKDRPQPMASKEFIKYLKDLHEQYRVFAFEDPLVADAWGDWKALTAELGDTAMIVADDLVATNKTLLIKAIQEKACNAIVIKPNRIGTVTETIEIVSIAKQAGWHTIMSHRSSETTDDFLADLAVGIGTDYVKFGAPSRGERVVKYNRLLRVEEILRSSQPEAASAAGANAATASLAATEAQFPATASATSSPSYTPATQTTGLPGWMSGAPMDNNTTTAADTANADATNTASPVPPVPTDASVSPAPVPNPAPLASPTPVAPPAIEPTVDVNGGEPLAAAPELTVTPPPSLPSTAPALPTIPTPAEIPGGTPGTVAPALEPTSAPAPSIPTEPSVTQPTAPSLGDVQPSNVQPSAVQPIAAPDPGALPDATHIQDSLNELAQMVTPGTPGSTPDLSAAVVAPDSGVPPSTSEVSVPTITPTAPISPIAPETPVTAPEEITIPTAPLGNTPGVVAAPTESTPSASVGGLPRPVPPSYS